MKYREDIDGLRAIAVLAVIFYHLDFPFISGGFVGVDIFFVISGFLITQTIYGDLDRDRFTISRFYIKRIRRIIPVLFFTTTITTIIATVLLPIDELEEFALSLFSVSIFSSNIFFWQNIDYFAVSAELKPLLHTWSLGIEEQFYILFPLFILWTRKLSYKLVIFWIALFMVISFIISASPIGVSHLQANFFLPITRFWELFIGVVLAMIIRDSRFKIEECCQNLNNALASIGLLLIIVPMFLLNHNSIFPATNALYPVIGSVLIIYSAHYSRTWLSDFLSHKVIRYMGIISFSLYLWHWIIISFAKNMIFGELSLLLKISILILTFALSSLSYRFIEKPFRVDKNLKEFLQIKNGTIALIILGSLALFIYLYIRVFYPNKQSLHDSINCFKKEMTLESTKECSFGDVNSSRVFVLYGDSHASAIYPAFEQLAKERKMRGILLPLFGCVPLFDVFRADGVGNASNCTGEYAKNIERFLERNRKEIERVYIVSRWDIYEKGWRINGRLREATHFISDEQTDSKNAKESAEVLKKALLHTVDRINGEMKIELTILKSVPILNGKIDKWGSQEITRTKYLSQQAYTNTIFQSLKDKYKITVLDPIDIFCPKDICLSYNENIRLYIDDNHLSYEGAMMMYPILKGGDNEPDELGNVPKDRE
jgi:peptidoglycan/LPS O-acetylase OafA/YrhL